MINYLEADYLLKVSSWILVRKIEEKLTSAMQQKIAFNEKLGKDFYLKISNFKRESRGSRTQKFNYKKKLSRLMNQMKIEQHNILFSNRNLAEKYDYLPFSKYLSEISFSKKINILNFLKDEEKTNILKRFGQTTNNQRVWIFKQLRFFRNYIAHHSIVISKNFKITDNDNNSEMVNISKFLPYLYELASPNETKKFKDFLKVNTNVKNVFEKIDLDL